jgi:hypothetical protein
MSLGSDNANWSMERLVEIRELKGKVADLETEIYELLEENERLRKAGYAMAVKINVHGINDKFTDNQKLVDDWCKAAKGVQS